MKIIITESRLERVTFNWLNDNWNKQFKNK